jgi:hypothetical protein
VLPFSRKNRKIKMNKEQTKMEVKTTFLLMIIFETGMPYTWFTLALGRARGIILMVP